MKNRIRKKMVRNGICPRCRGEEGISQFDMGTWKRVSNFCSNCYTVAVISGSGVVMDVDREAKAFFESEEQQETSNE